MKLVQIYIRKETKARLAKLCKSLGMTLSGAAGRIIESACDSMEFRSEKEKGSK